MYKYHPKNMNLNYSYGHPYATYHTVNNKPQFYNTQLIDNNLRAKECMEGVYIKTPDQKIYSGINSITFFIENLYRSLNKKESEIEILKKKIRDQELTLQGYDLVYNKPPPKINYLIRK